MNNILLKPLTKDGYEDFVIRNQQAFIMAVEDEFGELDEEPISQEDIRACLNHPLEEAYNIVYCGKVVGGVAVRVDKESSKNSLGFVYMVHHQSTPSNMFVPPFGKPALQKEVFPFGCAFYPVYFSRQIHRFQCVFLPWNKVFNLPNPQNFPLNGGEVRRDVPIS